MWRLAETAAAPPPEGTVEPEDTAEFIRRRYLAEKAETAHPPRQVETERFPGRAAAAETAAEEEAAAAPLHPRTNSYLQASAEMEAQAAREAAELQGSLFYITQRKNGILPDSLWTRTGRRSWICSGEDSLFEETVT